MISRTPKKPVLETLSPEQEQQIKARDEKLFGSLNFNDHDSKFPIDDLSLFINLPSKGGRIIVILSATEEARRSLAGALYNACTYEKVAVEFDMEAFSVVDPRNRYRWMHDWLKKSMKAKKWVFMAINPKLVNSWPTRDITIKLPTELMFYSSLTFLIERWNRPGRSEAHCRKSRFCLPFRTYTFDTARLREQSADVPWETLSPETLKLPHAQKT